MAMQPIRYEKRSVKAVAVMLASLDPAFAAEMTFTENISGRGARVLTQKVWPAKANDFLVIKSLEGDLQSEVRIVYRQPLHDNLSAVGLELLAPNGNWQEKSR